MLLLWLACTTYPDEPPAARSKPNRFDTAVDDGPAEFVRTGGSRGKGPIIQAARINRLSGTQSAKLTVTARDPDGDRISTKIDWFVNNERVTGQNGDTLHPSHFVKGDVVSAKVVVSDGQNSTEKLINGVTVGNSPPTFVTRRSDFKTIDGFRLKVEDPDGDVLTYTLEDAPPGMSISSDGVLSYSGSNSGTGGSYSTRIVVSDPNGESIVWPIDLSIQAGSGG